MAKENTVAASPAPGKPVVVSLIEKQEQAISSVLIHQMGNTTAMHILRSKLTSALKSVK